MDEELSLLKLSKNEPSDVHVVSQRWRCPKNSINDKNNKSPFLPSFRIWGRITQPAEFCMESAGKQNDFN